MARVAELCKMSDKGYAASMVVTNHNKKVRLLLYVLYVCDGLFFPVFLFRYYFANLIFDKKLVFFSRFFFFFPKHHL